jgi:hypothetical protein
MATGTVSSVSGDVWQLIQTTTVTAGQSSITLSSISGYKTIMVSGRLTNTLGSNTTMYVTLNNDQTAGNYIGNNANSFSISTAAGAAISSFSFRVHDVDKSMPHQVQRELNSSTAFTQFATYFTTSPITSIQIWNDSGLAGAQTWASGTVYWYGIPA